MRGDLVFLITSALCCCAWIIATYAMQSSSSAAPAAISLQRIVLCVLITDHEAFNRTLRVLNSAFAPPGTSVDLMVVVSPIEAAHPWGWKHGRWMLLRNISTVRYDDSQCLVLIDDTMDASPFFLYWFWGMWKRYGHHKRLIVAGSREGTGLMPQRWMWRRFVRRYVSAAKKGVVWPAGTMTRRFVDLFADATVAAPPLIDGCAIMRAEHQPMTERERVPRLARIWSEGFVSGAVFSMNLTA
jgi:hypothetical protein